MSDTKVKEFEIPYWITDSVTLLSGIATIVGTFASLFSVRNIVRKLPEGQYEVVLNQWLVNFSIVLICLLIIVFLKMRKYGKLLQKARKVITKNYYQFLHDFRNQYFDMVKEHKVNASDDRNHKIELLTRSTKGYLIKSLDYLCNIISSATGTEVSACIKVIDNIGGDGNSIDIEKALIRTFCRSSNTDGERVSNDLINGKNKSVRVMENTDFYDILIGESSSIFYQRDLLQYAKKLEEADKVYRNTTEQYWKYYRGTIVAPIRIARERLYYIDSDDDFDVIGFLCVDTLSTSAFRNKDKTFYSKIVKAFAAELYIILNKYNFYLKKIKEV